jgi:FkbH-like protein
MDKNMQNYINIAVISNIIFEPHFISLIQLYFGNNIKIHRIAYNEYNEEKYIKSFGKSEIIIVWLNFESLFPDMHNLIYSNILMEQHITEKIIFQCEKLHTDLSVYSKAKIIWFSFEDYYHPLFKIIGYNYNNFIDNINMKISSTLVANNVSFIDTKYLITTVGIYNVYNPKGKYRWNAPYSKSLIENGITKKCIILDCDNVLWGGILSEDGITKIKLGGSGLGRAYQDFQRFLLSLYYHGVILAVCSKNDLSNVMIVFNEHDEMILKEKHIACFQVNWENKPDNIKRIAETLNISLDSMVFVDDSLIEIEAVKSMLPEVTAILYERDSIYRQLSLFNLKSNINITDIEKRNETYRTDQSRGILRSKYESYEDYITALEIKIDIHKALPIEFNRIAELTQRTNKCTNGKRYTVAEIKKRLNNNKMILYSLSVSDRFSDLGLVGAIEIEENTLNLFSLSCRALGREIEGKMLEFIKNKNKIHHIVFQSTGNNADIKTMLLTVFPDAVLINNEP